jgi:hypothetical protein
MGPFSPTIWLAGGALALFSLLGKHALDMKKEKNYREMWGSLALSLLPAAVFWLWAVSGESAAVTRNLFLIPVGAIIGGCAFAWAGYVWSDIAAARTQTSSGGAVQVAQGSSGRELLASSLDDLASAIAGAPPVVIGSRTVVTAGPGTSGTVIGKQVTVEAGPGARGTIIGEQTTVTAGGPNATPPINDSVAQELRSGAATIRQGGGSRTMIANLLVRAQLPGAPDSVQQAMAVAAQTLANSDLQ